jgi:hypothetical protein
MTCSNVGSTEWWVLLLWESDAHKAFQNSLNLPLECIVKLHRSLVCTAGVKHWPNLPAQVLFDVRGRTFKFRNDDEDYET